MTQKTLPDSIMHRIKSENIMPVPRWHFIIKNMLFWLVFITAVMIGSVTVSMMILHFNMMDIQALKHLRIRRFIHWMQIAPVLWGVSFFGLFFAATVGLHHTNKGYKIPQTTILLLNFLLTIIGGMALYSIQLADKIEARIGVIERQRTDFWNHANEGRLAGIIVDIRAGDETILLRTKQKNEWLVDISDLRHKPEVLYKRNRVQIYGNIISEGVFKAENIQTWRHRTRKKDTKTQKNKNNI